MSAISETSVVASSPKNPSATSGVPDSAVMLAATRAMSEMRVQKKEAMQRRAMKEVRTETRRR